MTEAVNLATFTKDMLEDHQHQMNWERGQIDYLGVDSFDNILRQIDTSITPREVSLASIRPAGEGQVQPLEPRPPPSDLDQTEHAEVFVRGIPRKREVISSEQVEECKRSPSKKAALGFRPKPKPMKGQGQQDHREKYVRVPRTRNQQSVSNADLQVLLSGPSCVPTDS